MLIALHTSSLPADAQGGVPEWLHLIPTGTFAGVDGRGPYVNDNPEALVALFNSEGRKLPIDENHSIDLLSSKGQSTPARGWIVALENRADGVWGKVEWTPEGKAMMTSRSYGFLSPVFLHTAKMPYRVGKLVSAALTNNPNLNSLKSLHTREDAVMLKEIREALGLPETADEAAVLAAVKSAHTASTAHAALMPRFAALANAPAGTTGDALVTALQSAVTKPVLPGDAATEVAELKGQVLALQNQLTGYVQVTSQERATTTIDKAIAEGKIMPVLRDLYISRHVKDAAEVEKEIALLPSLHTGGVGGRLLPKSGGEAGAEPDADEKAVMAMMGVDPAAYAETRKKLVKAEG